ncbi:MAG: hypothetical protein GY701_31145 [Sulfitobacter sp.]|nr:hypothetical protein [Sulfitobacter sp.]
MTGGYTGVAQAQMLALVELFDGRVPDAEVHQHLTALIADTGRWREAHGYFGEVRRRLNASTDRVGQLHYSFAEACLKTVFNETPTKAPFDNISPFWVVPAALALAAELRMPLESVAACLTASQHEGMGGA